MLAERDALDDDLCTGPLVSTAHPAAVRVRVMAALYRAALVARYSTWPERVVVATSWRAQHGAQADRDRWN